MIKKPDTYIPLKEKIAHTLPLLKEAQKHNNRKLINDLAAPLVKELDKAIADNLEANAPIWSAIKRQISTFLLRSAYVKEKEELSLPGGAPTFFPKRSGKLSEEIESTRERRLGADAIGLPEDEGEDIEEGVGVVQPNTNRMTSRDIRDVINDADQKFLDYDDNFELDKPAQICDNNSIDSPFSVKDFSLASMAKKQVIEDTLIEELEALRQRVLQGGEI